MIETPTLPRITLPGADTETIALLQAALGEAEAQDRHVRAQQRGMALAMVRLGKPIFRSGKAKRSTPTKHVRHMARMKARSLKGATA